MSRAIAVHHDHFGRACLYEINRSLATHAHREGHLIFYLDGQCPAMEVAETAYIANKTNAIAVNPLQPHSMDFNTDQADTLLLILYINPHWFMEMEKSTDDAFRFACNQIDVTPQIDELVQLVAQLLVDGSRLVDFDGYLCELTQACFDQSRQQARTSSKDLRLAINGIVRDHRVRKSIRLMKERVADDLTLDNIASAAGMSRPHFYKLFRENVGITPNVYLNTLRVELAIDRLVTTSEAVTSIGLDLGFASQASFTRFFGTHVGIPPTDYRRVAHFG